MRMFLRHLAIITVVALSPMAIVTLATPAVSSADCGGRGWDPVAKLCVPPPSLPDCYRAAPTWAQNFVWARNFGEPCNPQPQGITVDVAGNVYTVGHLCGTSDFDPGHRVQLTASSPMRIQVPSAASLFAQASRSGVAGSGQVIVYIYGYTLSVE